MRETENARRGTESASEETESVSEGGRDDRMKKQTNTPRLAGQRAERLRNVAHI